MLRLADAFKAIAIGTIALSVAAMADTSSLAADGSSQATSAKRQLRKSADLSARLHYDSTATPVDDGYYYDRPVAYRPYPYVLPAPFPFGIGFDPLW